MLKLRGKTWYTRFTAPDGSRVFESARTGDRRLAAEYEAALKTRLWRESKLGEAAPRAWDDAVIAWIAAHGSKATLRKDQANLRWLDPHLRGRPLASIDTDTLAELHRLRCSEPRDKRRQDVPADAPRTSTATANRMMALVRSILRDAQARGWLARVPDVPMPDERRQAKEPRMLTPEEAAALMREVAPHLQPIMALALATGLREQNVLRLEWSRVSLERRVAWIDRTATKAGRAIGVPLSADAVAILEAQRGQHARWVFPSPRTGVPLARASNSGWYGARRRSGVDVRWHDLRHTWASWHAMAGTTLRDLMDLGGWASLSMVLRYAHLSPSHLAEAAERVRVPMGGGADSVQAGKAGR
jgi:integrase